MSEQHPEAVEPEGGSTRLRRDVRVARTVDEIERLHREVNAWKAARDAADVQRRFVTQLNALVQIVTRALGDLCSDARAIGDDPDVGSVYARCDLQDKRVLWVRRVLWGFYREKFDQRDGSAPLREMLAAADDVVWSCYAEPFIGLSRATLPGPIPLAYVEPVYSPQALPRNEVPGTLKDRRLGERLLKEFFAELPIPLVSLPPVCVAEPWWLVSVGHEVGHHVQHDLKLVDPFAEVLARAVTGTGTESRRQAMRWAEWGQEIFADVFALHMMGSVVIDVVDELVMSRAHDMLIAQDQYPAPLVRLALLRAVAARLGLDVPESAGPPAIRGAGDSDDDIVSEARGDLALVGTIANCLVPDDGPGMEALPGAIGDVSAAAVTSMPVAVSSLPPFRTLCGWNALDFAPGGAVPNWIKAFRNGRADGGGRSLAAARHAISASVGVWREVARQTTKTARASAMHKLRPLVLQAIESTRDETTRDVDRTVTTPVADLAGDLSGRLRSATAFEW
jgi:hypothetical protein